MAAVETMETIQFASGAVRSADLANLRYDLISPIGMRRLAETCAEGARKYDDFNWERGMPIAEMLNHAMGHINNYLAGDRSEDHLAHAAWNLFGAMHSEELWPHLNEGTLRGPGCRPPTVPILAEQAAPKSPPAEPAQLDERREVVVPVPVEANGSVVKDYLTTGVSERVAREMFGA